MREGAEKEMEIKKEDAIFVRRIHRIALSLEVTEEENWEVGKWGMEYVRFIEHIEKEKQEGGLLFGYYLGGSNEYWNEKRKVRVVVHVFEKVIESRIESRIES